MRKTSNSEGKTKAKTTAAPKRKRTWPIFEKVTVGGVLRKETVFVTIRHEMNIIGQIPCFNGHMAKALAAHLRKARWGGEGWHIPLPAKERKMDGAR